MALDTTTAKVRVNLAPAPGFCVKSTAQQAAVCRVSESQASPSTLTGGLAGTLVIPKGIKVFVNIAWDANVPPPPEGNEDAIQRAMRGEEELDESADGAWFVPVIVSEPRSDVDKAGKPTVVFDCLYNASLKSRCLRDPAFRAFLVELALQRIEVQHALRLGRLDQLGTPNIASKGKLKPRTALVPLALYPPGHPLRASVPHGSEGTTEGQGAKKLIEEVEAEPVAKGKGKGKEKEQEKEKEKPKGILKKPESTSTPAPAQKAKPAPKIQELDSSPSESQPHRPKFEWSKAGSQIQITVHVPKLTYAHIPTATLDIEPRRLILSIPSLYSLDLDLDLSDAELSQTLGSNGEEEVRAALTLKRERDFDVDGAKAEWRVQEGRVVVEL